MRSIRFYIFMIIKPRFILWYGCLTKVKIYLSFKSYFCSSIFNRWWFSYIINWSDFSLKWLSLFLSYLNISSIVFEAHFGMLIKTPNIIVFCPCILYISYIYYFKTCENNCKGAWNIIDTLFWRKLWHLLLLIYFEKY